MTLLTATRVKGCLDRQPALQQSGCHPGSAEPCVRGAVLRIRVPVQINFFSLLFFRSEVR